MPPRVSGSRVTNERNGTLDTNTKTGRFGSYDEWIDRDLYDSDGEKVGGISAIYYDNMTGRPEWVGVRTGMFGAKSSFVPISGATTYKDPDGDDEHLQVQFSKEQIKDAPNVEDNGELSPAEEQELYSHYGFDWKGQDKTFGYQRQGKAADRLDKEYRYRRFDQERKDWSVERQHDEHEVIPVSTTAQVTVPVEAQVRLRKYQTQQTKQVTMPVTETEEHVEVEGVDTKGTTR